MDEKPSSLQRAIAIVMGTAIIVWIIYVNKKLVDDVEKGGQPPAAVSPTPTPSP